LTFLIEQFTTLLTLSQIGFLDKIYLGILKMKKIFITLLSLSAIGSSIALADKDSVVATYSNQNVTEGQIMDQFGPSIAAQFNGQNKNFNDLERNVRESLVRNYVSVKLLEEEVKKSDISSSKEFKEKMKLVEQQMVQQEFIDRYIKNHVNEKMVADEYKKLVDSLQGKEEIKTSHILVESEEKAKDIKKKLAKGVKFGDLAKEFSKDDGSKASGGELGYTVKGQLVPEFEEKAFALKKNEISEPVKTQFGWHIIKMHDKRPAQIPTKEQATQHLTNKLAREAVEKYISELINKANLQVKF
jgi:peptidylprolyl isomerase/peptidyl-prolyl cis-trans isomerase C